MRPHPLFAADRAAPTRPAWLGSDPRWWLFQFIAVLAATFLVDGNAGLLVVIGYALFLFAVMRLPGDGMFAVVRGVVGFAAIIVLINAVLVPGRPVAGALGWASWEGLAVGTHLALRVCALFIAAFVFLSAMTPVHLAAGLAGMVAPVSRSGAAAVAFYGFLSLAFLPVYADEARRVHLAQRFRGGGIEGGLRARLDGARLLIVPLILSAVRRSGQLAMAAEVRGIRDSIHRVIEFPRTRPGDWVMTGVTLSLMVVAVLAM